MEASPLIDGTQYWLPFILIIVVGFVLLAMWDPMNK